MPQEIGVEIDQEFKIKKCNVFWNGKFKNLFITFIFIFYSDEGILFLHLYAPIYLETDVPKKIENVNIEDLYYPKCENEMAELEDDDDFMEE